MPLVRLLVAGALLVTAVTITARPAEAKRKPDNVSWTKPGVSFADYQHDALTCANQTYGLEVSMKPGTAHALAALNGAQLAGLVQGLQHTTGPGGADYRGAAGYQAAMNVVAPDRVLYRNSTYTQMFRVAAYHDVVDQLQAVLDYCLVSHGYRRFTLTGEQLHQLRQYPKGSEQRARYAYTLARAAG
ncbi:hypothetical protein [Sphingomonas sp. BAUL-RG-20F-R05-02]|uniref:hypothetical protein n=1 Tax=Sphingomonas sp. BAUL-RG-20F-R05-02 TaxID=2914830 RepID=UPI001F55CF25|nr:hypothetical protein [Sphingomonas sp. BAUL-RG-20F-R05-02]